MKVFHACVTPYGFREKRANTIRLELLSKILDSSKGTNADLVLLRAGYLWTQNINERNNLADKCAKMAKSARVSVQLGIDVGIQSAEKPCGKTKEQVKGSYPFHIYIFDSKGQRARGDGCKFCKKKGLVQAILFISLQNLQPSPPLPRRCDKVREMYSASRQFFE